MELVHALPLDYDAALAILARARAALAGDQGGGVDLGACPEREGAAFLLSALPEDPADAAAILSYTEHVMSTHLAPETLALEVER